MDSELLCWLWHCAATAVALQRHERTNAFNLVLIYDFSLSRPRGLSSTTMPRCLLVPCVGWNDVGRWPWVMWVTGQLCDGSRGSWVTKDDPFPPLLLSTESECSRGAKSNTDESADSPFCLLLKSTQNVPLGPRSTLQMPVTFAPHEMRMYQVRCTVSVRREDGLAWDDFSCRSNQQNG